MMQKYTVVPFDLNKKNPSKEFFKYMEEHYDERDSELIYVDENLLKVTCYDIEDIQIFVSNKPFQKKGLASVVISEDTFTAYLIKTDLEEQTGFKLVECKNGN
ncbi:hypothetical protein KAR52_01240 [Candidatus Pacearchaeota archaeon]|nr:hypothetical protein [Candidatus Pacearchaeota archaeon]